MALSNILQTNVPETLERILVFWIAAEVPTAQMITVANLMQSIRIRGIIWGEVT